MNARFSEINNSELFAVETPIGKVVDLLVEDNYWKVRYLVVEIYDAFTTQAKRVLISPEAISEVNLESNSIKTQLDIKSVVTSPSLDEDQPVSRQHEQALVEHYGWPVYWLGRTVMPAQQLDAFANLEENSTVQEDAVANLRSAAEICGYQIQSKNGRAGTMNDLVVDLKQWGVCNGVAESSSWLPSESSMFWISHIDSVDWSKREITVDLSSEVLLPQSPEGMSFSSLLPASQGFMVRRTAFE